MLILTADIAVMLLMYTCTDASGISSCTRRFSVFHSRSSSIVASDDIVSIFVSPVSGE